MAVASGTGANAALHPLHAMLLAFPLALFSAAWLADLAYSSSYQIQWVNFAAWLNAGGLLVGALVLLWALVGLIRRRRGAGLYAALLLLMWGLGLVNAFVHGRDAYGAMPAGLYLSAVVALLAVAAAFVGYSGAWARGVR